MAQVEAAEPQEAPSESSSRTAVVAQTLMERLELFVLVFGFALLMLKVARVSHLNPRTSLGLIEGVGPLSVIFGSLVAHFPIILFIIAGLAVWWGVGSFVATRVFAMGHGVVVAILFFSVFLLPWPYNVTLAVVGVVRFFQSRAAPERVGRRRQYYALVGALAILLITDSDVWLPPETFVVIGEAPFVGYELAELDSGGWVTVLRDEDRMILRVKEDAIEDRRPCRDQGEDFELANLPSLYQLAIGERSELPEPLCDS